MSRLRTLILGCSVAMLAACSDSSIGPRPRPSDNAEVPSGHLLQLVGVLEASENGGFGLRLGDNLVPLLCSFELESEVGKEIRVWGNFNAQGAFAVARYDILDEDDDDPDKPVFLRAPLARSKVMPRSGRKL